jgi:acetolactate synthase-1/2/3 large subunit
MAEKDIKPGTFDLGPDYPGKFIVNAMEECGCDFVFGVWGGHMWPMVDTLVKSPKIKFLTMRHEQTGGYAAEAYARATGKPSVALGTVGPGTSNMVSPAQQAFGSNTPVLFLCGGHEQQSDASHTLQEAYAVDLYKPITKWSARMTTSAHYKYFVKKAFREMMEAPRGPCALEIELANLLSPPSPLGHNLYLENSFTKPPSVPHADPAAVAEAVDMIYSVDKPVMYVADGMLWNNAAQYAREFIKLAKVPTLGRRGGRGTIPENDPLCFKTAGIINDADLTIFAGARLDFYDFWGGRWELKRCIQINDCVEFLHPWLPTDLPIEAEPGAFFKQAVAYIKEKGLKPPAGRKAWCDHVAEVEKGRFGRLDERALKGKEWKPIHLAWMSKCAWDIVEQRYKGECPYIFDAFTGSNVFGPFVKARYAGQQMDSGIQAGVGHGIGQSIGLSMAHPDKVVLACMGDAGMGNSGMDIETAVRYKCKVVYMVCNNDGWMPGCKFMYGKNWDYYELPKDEPPPHEFIPKQRYDLMFEAIGCHGEYVENPDDITGALNRAFDAAEQGKPAVVNVIVSQKPIQSVLFALAQAMWTHIPWEKLPRIGQKVRRIGCAELFPWDEYGIEQEDVDPWFWDDEDWTIG